MKMKRVHRSCLGLVLLLALLCSFCFRANAADAKISRKKATLYTSQTLKLKVTGAIGKVSWSSSNKKVATVGKKGKVTAKKAGTATITAKTGGKKLKCKVTVKAPKLSRKTLTLQVGQSETISLKGGSIKSASSSDKKVAKVTKKGKITGVSAGKAKITFKDKQGKRYVCTVTVTKSSDEAAEAETGALASDPETEKQTAVSEPKQPETPAPESETPAPGSETQIPESETQTPESETQAPESETPAPESETQMPESETQTSESETQMPESETQIPESETQPQESEPQIEDSDITVASQEELERALATDDTVKITLATSAEQRFIITEGKYTSKQLVINAPNAEVINNANFSTIVIKAIAANTYIENAVGNTIICEASSAKIEVSEGASASLVLNEATEPEEAPQITIVNDGTVTDLTLNTAAEVTITESSSETQTNTAIPTVVSETAQDSKVVTSQNLTLTLDSSIELVLQPGAEDTTAYVSSESTDPESALSVSGVGSVEVIDVASGILVDTVVAENVDTEEAAGVSVAGQVKLADGTALEGASLFLIPYSSSLSQAEILRMIDDGSQAAAAVTDEQGAYTFAAGIGNYFLAAAADGYKTEMQTLIISSLNQGSYTNSTITLVKDGEALGSIVGTLIDSRNGLALDYTVEVRLRAGLLKTSGAALSTQTVTDGSFYFENLEAGTYTIQVVSSADSDVIVATSSFTVVVAAGAAVESIGTVSRALGDDQIQFVLHWGSASSGAPRDLDAHLYGPDGAGGSFHIYATNRNFYNDDGEWCAGLDLDSYTYEGPETITAYRISSGVYSFYVYDFTDRKEESSANLSNNSAAYVEVKQGSATKAVFHIPTGQSGNLWHVCDYNADTNRFVSVNTVGYWPYGAENSIGMETSLEIYQEMLGGKLEVLTELVKTLAEGTYRTNVETLLSQAEQVYETSTDEKELLTMRQTLSAKIEEIYDAINITAVRCENMTDRDMDTLTGLIYIIGRAAELGEITIEAENASGDAVSVQIEDTDEEGYVKAVTFTDAATGATRIFHIVYRLDSSVFDIQSVSGENVLTYEIDRYSDYGYLYIKGITETLPEFTLEITEGVTWQLETDDEGTIIRMYYGSGSCYYRVYYTQVEQVFRIAEVSGDGILFYTSEMNATSGTLRLTGFASEVPDYEVASFYSQIEVVSRDNQVLTLQLKDQTYTYQVEYAVCESSAIEPDTPQTVQLDGQIPGQVFTFTPEETAVYECWSYECTDCTPVGLLYEDGTLLIREDSNHKAELDDDEFCIRYQLKGGIEYSYVVRDYSMRSQGSFNVMLAKCEGEEDDNGSGKYDNDDNSRLVELQNEIFYLLDRFPSPMQYLAEGDYRDHVEELLAQVEQDYLTSQDEDELSTWVDTLSQLYSEIGAVPQIASVNGENVDTWGNPWDNVLYVYVTTPDDPGEVTVEVNDGLGRELQITYADLEAGENDRKLTVKVLDTGVEYAWYIRYELTRNMFQVFAVTGDSVIGYEQDLRWYEENEDGTLCIVGTTQAMPEFTLSVREGVTWEQTVDEDGSPIIRMTYGEETYTSKLVYRYETFYFGIYTVYFDGMMDYKVESGETSGTIYLYGLSETMPEYYVYPTYQSVVQESHDSTCVTLTFEDDGSTYTYDVVYIPVDYTVLSLDTEEEVELDSDVRYKAFTFTPEETGIYVFRSYDNSDYTYVELYENSAYIGGGYASDEGKSFCLTQTLQAGMPYTFKVKDYEPSETGRIVCKVVLTKTEDAVEANTDLSEIDPDNLISDEQTDGVSPETEDSKEEFIGSTDDQEQIATDDGQSDEVDDPDEIVGEDEILLDDLEEIAEQDELLLDDPTVEGASADVMWSEDEITYADLSVDEGSDTVMEESVTEE